MKEVKVNSLKNNRGIIPISLYFDTILWLPLIFMFNKGRDQTNFRGLDCFSDSCLLLKTYFSLSSLLLLSNHHTTLPAVPLEGLHAFLPQDLCKCYSLSLFLSGIFCLNKITPIHLWIGIESESSLMIPIHNVIASEKLLLNTPMYIKSLCPQHE